MSDKCKKCPKKCPSLRLIKTPEEPKYKDTEFEKAETFEIKDRLKDGQNRNFWNSCPQQFEYLPEQSCSSGKVERNEKGKVIREASCDWYIESERDNNCFWKFIKRKSDPDGNMLPMLQSEIAEKFGCSPTKIHFIIKEAMEKLKDNGYLEYLSNLSDNIPDEDEREEDE